MARYNQIMPYLAININDIRARYGIMIGYLAKSELPRKGPTCLSIGLYTPKKVQSRAIFLAPPKPLSLYFTLVNHAPVSIDLIKEILVNALKLGKPVANMSFTRLDFSFSPTWGA